MAQRARVPVYIVLAWSEAWQDPALLERHLRRARSGNYALLLLGNDDDFSPQWSRQQHSSMLDADVALATLPISPVRLLSMLRHHLLGISQRLATAALELDLERARHENDMLISIGRALSQERDIGSLMSLILKRACEVTSADAGSVYSVEGNHDDISKRMLRFVASQNDSRTVESAGFEIPVSYSSIVGASVLSSEVLNVLDLYALDPPKTGNNLWGFIHDRTFDIKNKYQTRSVLVVPMISARGEVIGVIQLINRRAKGWLTLELPEDFVDGVVPFDDIAVAYVSALR
jgi:GAF domain